MLTHGIPAYLATVLCGLSQPEAASPHPAALAFSAGPAPIVAPADDSGDLSDLSDFPTLPDCPQGQEYGMECLLKAQFTLLRDRIAEHDLHQANLASIEETFAILLAAATSPSEKAAVLAAKAAAIAAEVLRHQIVGQVLDANYLQTGDYCCEDGMGLPAWAGLNGCLEPPKVTCPGGAAPDQDCVKSQVPQYQQAVIAAVWETEAAIQDYKPGDPEPEWHRQHLLGKLATISGNWIQGVRAKCCEQ